MNPYNPLEKQNLAESVAEKLLDCPVKPLEGLAHFKGAGVYVLYYVGNFPAYAPYKNDVTKREFSKPIYIGKADPAGSRVGRSLEVAPKNELYSRLKQHLKSVREAQNLDSSDFYFRHLVVDDIWIPLGEALLISKLKPVWNKSNMQGFGIHSPGKGREGQKRSQWDTVHPGRTFAENLQPALMTQEEILARLQEPSELDKEEAGL